MVQMNVSLAICMRNPRVIQEILWFYWLKWNYDNQMSVLLFKWFDTMWCNTYKFDANQRRYGSFSLYVSRTFSITILQKWWSRKNATLNNRMRKFSLLTIYHIMRMVWNVMELLRYETCTYKWLLINAKSSFNSHIDAIQSIMVVKAFSHSSSSEKQSIPKANLMRCLNSRMKVIKWCAGKQQNGP